MREKIKAIFDNRATWATLGAMVGVALGEKAATVTNAVGALVMAVL